MPETKDIIKLLDKGEVDAALALAPDVGDKGEVSSALNDYGVMLAKEVGAYDEVKKMLKTAIEIDPKFAEAHYNLGCLYSEPEVLSENPNNLEKSIKEYQKAIKIDSKHTRAHFNLGLIYAFAGDIENAKEHYSSCIRTDPKNIGKYDSLEGIIKSKSV